MCERSVFLLPSMFLAVSILPIFLSISIRSLSFYFPHLSFTVVCISIHSPSSLSTFSRSHLSVSLSFFGSTYFLSLSQPLYLSIPLSLSSSSYHFPRVLSRIISCLYPILSFSHTSHSSAFLSIPVVLVNLRLPFSYLSLISV